MFRELVVRRERLRPITLIGLLRIKREIDQSALIEKARW